MKKIILSIVAVLAFGFTNAQDKKDFGFSKGDAYVSGSFSTSSKSGHDSVITFAPSASLFVSNNITLNGLYSIEMVAGHSTTHAGIGASYHFNADKQFSSNIGLGIGVTTGTGYTATGTDMSLSYGIKYFVSNHFILSADIAALKYRLIKNGEGPYRSADFGINFSNISLGLAYKF
jgi:hypothetical protein